MQAGVLVDCLEAYKSWQSFEKQIGSSVLRNFKIHPPWPNLKILGILGKFWESFSVFSNTFPAHKFQACHMEFPSKFHLAHLPADICHSINAKLLVLPKTHALHFCASEHVLFISLYLESPSPPSWLGWLCLLFWNQLSCHYPPGWVSLPSSMFT